MARFTEINTKPIYDVGARFLEHCLQKDGSLIHDDLSVWSLDNLEKIRKAFNESPDTGGRTFTAKFADQIRPAGDNIGRLAAEILAVYFLFPIRSVGESRKKELVGEVLGWADDVLPPDSQLANAFDVGIGSGGPGFNMRRPLEIAFLIEFAIAWKRMSEADRDTAQKNPWVFMGVIDGIDGAEASQLRHMLLHMLFPDSFERIASGKHKRQIVESFKPVLDGVTPDSIDQCLLAIRKRLEELLGSNDLDFYRMPLKEVWSESGESGDDAVATDYLRYKKQVVLYGPPGTGKTYRANKIAEQHIRSALLSKVGPREYFQMEKEGKIDLKISPRIHRLQMHPAYGYEDFVRGLHINSNGATEYRLGFLPDLVEKMAGDDPDIPHVLILDEMNRTDLSRTLGECFSLLENRDKEISLPGRDSSGNQFSLRIPSNLFIIGTMNLIDQSVEQIDFALRRRFLWEYCGFNSDDLLSASKERWEKEGGRIAWDRIEGDFLKLAKAATALNNKIHTSRYLGEQYEIGHAYLLDTVTFLKDEIESGRPQSFLWDRRGRAKKPVELTWKVSIKPLLHEYLSGLDDTIRKNEISELAGVFLSVSMESD